MAISRRGARKWRAKIRARRTGKRAITSTRKAKRVLMRAKKRLFKRSMAKAKRAMAPPRVVALRTSNIIPPRKVVTMEYRGCFDASKIGSTGPAAVAMNGLKFKCNSIYDPYNGISGSFNVSTSLYKQYKEWYTYYRVIRSYAVFTLRQAVTVREEIGEAPVTANSNPAVKWGVLLDDDGSTTFGSAWPVYVQRPETKCKVFYANSHKSQSTIKMSWVNKFQPSGAQVSSTQFGTDPTNVDYWLPWWALAADGVGADVAPYGMLDVYIRYTVLVYEPLDLEAATVPMHQS